MRFIITILSLVMLIRTRYLVFLLMRFADKPHCTARIMAEDFLGSQLLHGEQRADSLREVGDHCLLFSGLFPELAERRLVLFADASRVGLPPWAASIRGPLPTNRTAPSPWSTRTFAAPTGCTSQCPAPPSRRRWSRG